MRGRRGFSGILSFCTVQRLIAEHAYFARRIVHGAAMRAFNILFLLRLFSSSPTDRAVREPFAVCSATDTGPFRL